MLLTITLILSGLVSFNLLLLYFSCNKTEKVVQKDKQPVKLKSRLDDLNYEEELAPTGS